MTSCRSKTDPEFLKSVAQLVETNGEVLAAIRFVFGAAARCFEFFSNFESLRERLIELNYADVCFSGHSEV